MYLFVRLYELQVFINNGILGFVILLPLVNQGNFKDIQVDLYILSPDGRRMEGFMQGTE